MALQSVGVSLDAPVDQMVSIPSMPDIMTTAMLAEQLPDVTEKTLEDWRYRRVGPVYARDERTRRVYYLKTDVLQWLTASRHDHTNN